VQRDWAGVPRLRSEAAAAGGEGGDGAPAGGGKRRERCVCAQLPADAPELRVYDGCAPDASRCRVPPAEAK
jgi:hypothetical protein